MKQDYVRGLLGQPTETAVRTFGAAVGEPWRGLEWEYRWPKKRLTLTFERSSDDILQWRLNSWHWSDF